MIMRMIFSKIFTRLFFQFVHFLFLCITASLQNMLDLRQGYHREEFCKKKITGKKQTKCSQIKSNLPDGRPVIDRPCRWKIFTINGGNDDHESFKPHSNVYKY